MPPDFKSWHRQFNRSGLEPDYSTAAGRAFGLARTGGERLKFQLFSLIERLHASLFDQHFEPADAQLRVEQPLYRLRKLPPRGLRLGD